MNTVIRPEISFYFNENCNVNILENEEKIGEISSAFYRLLCLFGGFLSDDQILSVFQKLDLTEEILHRVKKKYDYILIQSDTFTREFELFPLKDHKINFIKLRALVPNVIVISLTRDCFMKCRYCYAGANYSEKATEDNSLNINILRKILIEIKRYGITKINVTGGDPFCREDIFEILELFKINNIVIDISTKKRFADQEIEKLVEFKNTINLQISIDSGRDKIQKKLVGVSDYSSTMFGVLKKLVDAGFHHLQTNSVVTSINVDSIPDLIVELDKIGVHKCVLSLYTENLCRNDNSLRPSDKQLQQLLMNLDCLRTTAIIDKATIVNRVNPKSLFGKKVCSAGEDGLIIGPSGTVAICERILYNEEYSLGNVKENSLLEIWNSQKLKQFYQPNPELFKGTKCYKCSEVDICLNQRGICYVNSIYLNGTPFSPDMYCKYNSI